MSVVVLGSPKQIQSIMTPQYTMHVMQTVRITAGENVNMNATENEQKTKVICYTSTVTWTNYKNKQKHFKRTKTHADRHNHLKRLNNSQEFYALSIVKIHKRLHWPAGNLFWPVQKK